MTTRPPRSFGNRLLRLLVWLGVIVSVVWSAAWFGIAWWAEGRVAEMLEASNRNGVATECKDHRITGFPFRMGVSCASVEVKEPNRAFGLSSGAVTTAAHILNPGRFSANLTAPLVLRPAGVETRVNWSQFETSIDVAFSGLVSHGGVTFADLNADVQQASVMAKKGQGDVRPVVWAGDKQASEQAVVPQSLQAMIGIDGFSTRIPNLDLPPVDIRFDATLQNGYRDLVVFQLDPRAVLKDGAMVQLDRAEIKVPSDGRLAVSGPLELHEDGTVSGTLRIGISNPEAVAAWVAKLNPGLEAGVKGIGQAVAGMGKETAFPDGAMRSIEITIARGEMRLGFISLGKIPPLKLN